ncbi:putative gnat family protein [Botrytis fragariae]|uniref:Putative gnat family protein n=1 Tax=Botrytis fragariae TaxID=1964551 RepID=A0A8H6ATG2_9HELO|nr:putative gnat family protein [Botrytis fragariae]KAF5873291.1 putative gnat family protein [Botrytis fragariae]
MNTTDSMSNNTPPPPHPQQPTIRSFFQPKQPTYTPPPGTTPITTSDSHENRNGNAGQEIPPPQPASGPPSSTNAPLPPVTTATTATPDSLQSSSASSSQQLPRGYKIETPQDHHIQPLRRINALLLPIPYPDAFYHAITSPPSPSIPISLSFSRVVTYTPDSHSEPKVIGSIICRIDPSPPSSPYAQPPANTYSIYLQSLTLLSPYRTLGLATALLNSVIESATSSRMPIGVRIEGLYAHVWVDNQEALEWYTKRGFEKGELVEGYYRRLRPQDAFVFRRRFSVQDHISRQPQTNPTPVLNLIQNATAKSTPPPPPPMSTATRPPPSKHTTSFQDRRPEREWNDLPEEVFLRPRAQADEQSKESSRSSSRSGASGSGGKKKRSYPAAAFGS